VELRQLRYFVAIAERESFTRASEHLLIAQPALSAQIAKLEDELGVALFEKAGRGVRLTVPGRLVLAEAQRTLAAADVVERIARAGAEGAVGSIRVGYTRLFPFRDMTTVLRAFRQERPHVALVLREHAANEHAQLVRSGELDGAFGRLPDDVEEDGELTGYSLITVPTMVVLPRGHRLLVHRTVQLRELALEDWVVISRVVGGSIRDDVLALCRNAGFTPRIAQETPDVHVLFGLVAAGLGVAMGTSAGRDLAVRGIRFAATSPHLTIRYGLIVRRDAKAPALEALIREVCNAARLIADRD
jgi:DNA-binding transcriptional LysR family regulator